MTEYKVLIIDDDPWMQRILSKTLQNYGFKDVYLASNGFEGIAIAVEEYPHLIILDIMMPELSGHLTLKVIKHIHATQNIPVLMISALSDTENLGLSVKSGSAGFISKPFTRSTIYEKLINIYGKYNLDKIARGEEIDIDFSKSDILPENNELFGKEQDIMSALSSKESDLGSSSEVNNDMINRKEEEKKELDIIKKLLYKTKK